MPFNTESYFSFRKKLILLKKFLIFAKNSLPSNTMLKKNAISQPTIRTVVIAAPISMDKFKNGRTAIAAQAKNEITKRK